MSGNLNPSYHNGDLKIALIKAGLEILAESGIAELSLRKVAKRAGVSEAAPYRHYKDKDALLTGIAEQGFLRLSATLEQIEEAYAEDASVLFYQMGFAYVRFARTYSDSMRIMFRHRTQPSPSNNPSLQEATDQMFNYLIDLAEYCQQAELARPGHPLPLALSYWTAIHGLSMLLIDHGFTEEIIQGQTDETLARIALDNILYGWQGSKTL